MSIKNIIIKNITIGSIEFEMKEDKRIEDIECVMKQLIEHIKTLFTNLSNVNEKLEILTDNTNIN
jgi:hypothetical protein